jgi:hypothetical protein
MEKANSLNVQMTCQLCRKRLRLVECATCRKDYCFFCAFRYEIRVYGYVV